MAALTYDVVLPATRVMDFSSVRTTPSSSCHIFCLIAKKMLGKDDRNSKLSRSIHFSFLHFLGKQTEDLLFSFSS